MKHILFDCDSTVGLPDRPREAARYREEMYGGWLDFRLGDRL